MEAALAEMSVDDLMQDVEEDVDFVSKGMLIIIFFSSQSGNGTSNF
jgi:hypothetical protein